MFPLILCLKDRRQRCEWEWNGGIKNNFNKIYEMKEISFMKVDMAGRRNVEWRLGRRLSEKEQKKLFLYPYLRISN